MEDTDAFTPNMSGCNAVLCKYKITSDGDDAVSYKKALQQLQSTLRKDKYDGNGTMAQNDPLYKNLARCVGFFDNDKDRFPTQRNCTSKPSTVPSSNPKYSSKPKYSYNPFYKSNSRTESTPKDLKACITAINTLIKYPSNEHIPEIQSFITNIKSDVGDLEKYNLTGNEWVALNEIKRLMDIVSNMVYKIKEKNDEFATKTIQLQNEMDEYVAAFGGIRPKNYKSFRENRTNGPNHDAEGAKKRAKEDAKRAKEDAKRAKEEAKRAEQEAKRAEQEARIRELLRKEKEEEDRRRAESDERRRVISDERRRAISDERRRQQSKESKTKKNKQTRSSPRNNSTRKRCPNGTRRNKKTGHCDPHSK